MKALSYKTKKVRYNTMNCVKTIILAMALAASCPWCAARQAGRTETATTASSATHRNVYLKANALGYAFSVSNVAAEIDLNDRLSANLPVYFSAFNYFSAHTKFRTFTIQPELRYWITPGNMHTGWFLGTHLGLGCFNFATSGDMRYQSHKPALGGGLNVGYRMPIFSSGGRWMLEFAAGVGAYGVHVNQYRNEHNGLLVKSHRRAYVGPDNLAVSLVYRFGKKGGEQ